MEVDAVDASEAVQPQPPFPMGDVEDDYGEDIEYDDDLEAILQAAESQVGLRSSLPSSSDTRLVRLDGKGEAVTALPTVLGSEPMDIEDTPAPLLSPFERFRRHKYLSVSDLVGTVWCEVQVRFVICIGSTADGVSMISKSAAPSDGE
jgi:exonuclease V